MAMRLPLRARRSSWLALSRSRPSNRISPETMWAGGVSRRFMTAAAETDLPEPLSPSTASVSPRSIDQLTFLTAWTVPRAVWKSTERSRTASRASLIGGAPGFQPPALGGIEGDPHPVRQQVEREGG